MTAPDAQPPAARPYGRWIPPAFTLLGHTPKASPTGNSTFSACWECVCSDFLHVTQDGYYAGPAVERHCERAASPASAALDGTPGSFDVQNAAERVIYGVLMNLAGTDPQGLADHIVDALASHDLLASTPTRTKETDHG